jgi:hypothetical protein
LLAEFALLRLEKSSLFLQRDKEDNGTLLGGELQRWGYI